MDYIHKAAQESLGGKYGEIHRAVVTWQALQSDQLRVGARTPAKHHDQLARGRRPRPSFRSDGTTDAVERPDQGPWGRLASMLAKTWGYANCAAATYKDTGYRLHRGRLGPHPAGRRGLRGPRRCPLKTTEIVGNMFDRGPGRNSSSSTSAKKFDAPDPWDASVGHQRAR